MTTDTASRLAAIRERAEAATKGPWRVTTCMDYWVEQAPSDPNDDGNGIAHCGDIAWPDFREKQREWEANAHFIADARDDVPYLLALVDRMTERLAIYKSQVEAGAVRIAAAEAQIADAEMSLHTWDTSGSSEYWLRHGDRLPTADGIPSSVPAEAPAVANVGHDLWECPDCRHVNHEGHLYCACGRKIPGRPAAQSTPSPGHAEVAERIVAEWLGSYRSEHLQSLITAALSAAAAQEAEECAKVADSAVTPQSHTDWFDGRNEAASQIASAIRDRARRG